MSSLLNKFVPKREFESYEDFKENFKIDVPDNFNFAYDIVDEYAENIPDKIAMVWCNDEGDEQVFTFADMKYYSDKTANFFKKCGIKKGDTVMLTLKARYEFWFCIIGLHKIGAIAIPATHMLRAEDIVYRIKSAGLKMVVCIAEDGVPEYFDEADAELEDTKVIKVIVGDEDREGWLNFRKELEKSPLEFNRPTGDENTTNDDISLNLFLIRNCRSSKNG